MAQGLLAPLRFNLPLLRFRDLPPRCGDLLLRCNLALRRLLPLRLPLRLGRVGLGLGLGLGSGLGLGLGLG